MVPWDPVWRCIFQQFSGFEPKCHAKQFIESNRVYQTAQSEERAEVLVGKGSKISTEIKCKSNEGTSMYKSSQVTLDVALCGSAGAF